MKKADSPKTLLAAFIVCLMAAACSKAPVPEIEGTSYGKPLEQTQTLSISELVKRPDHFSGKRVRVKGLVTGVCQHKGCWLEISEENGPASVRFKVRDGVMVFPRDSPGKLADAEGIVRKVELDLKATIAFRKHEAEERGAAFDPASVKESMSMVMLDGIGAVLSESR